MGGGAGRLNAAFLSRLNRICRALSLLAAVIGAFVHWVLPLTVIAPGDEKTRRSLSYRGRTARPPFICPIRAG